MNPFLALNATNRQRRIWQPKESRGGVVMVELAIVANLLFCMIFVSFEFARFHLARNLTQDAAYYAARQAMVPGATTAEAQREATKILSAMFSQGYEVVIDPLGQQADYVVVTVSVDLHKVAFFTPMFLPDGKLTSVATLKTERYRGYYQPATS